MKSKHTFILLFFLFFIVNLFGQKITIEVKDADSNEPLPFSNICIKQLHSDKECYSITNTAGDTKFTLNDTSLITISFVGYKTFTDTIFPPFKDKQTYFLTPEVTFTEEIVITGQYKPVPIDKSIYQVKLINSQQIEQKAAINMADLLNNELNISVNHDPSTGSSLKMQGISGQNIKILIDGVPVIGRLNGNIDMSQIDLNNVDHIEIVEGPMSVMYGSNALAGAINIITKDNKYFKIKTGLNAYYESVGVYNLNANAAFKKKNNSFQITLGRNFFDGFDIDTATRIMDYKPKEQYNSELKYIYSNDKGFKTKLNTSVFKEKLLDRSNLYKTPYSIRGFDTWFNTIRSVSALQISKKFNERSNINFLSSYSYYFRSKQKYIKNMLNLESLLSNDMSDHDTTTFDAVTSQGIYNYYSENEKISIQSGFDMNYEHGTGKRLLNKTENILDVALFTGMQLYYIKNICIQPGVRIAYNSKYKAPIVPSLNIKFSPKEWTIRGSYARGFRAPSLKELYLHFYDANHQIEGNENLEAEYSHNFNLSASYEYVKSKYSMLFTVKSFYNDILNMINLVQVDPNNDLHFSNQNIGEFKSIGATATYALKISNKYNLETGFSRMGRSDINKNLKYIYYNTYSFSLSCNLFKHTGNVTVNYKYNGKYPFYTNFGELKLNYLENYHILNVAVSKYLFKKQLKISVGAKNLFDNTTVGGNTAGVSGGHGTSTGVSSLAGWGRTYYIGIKYQFNHY